MGVSAGVALDPELIDFGVHATFGPIFKRGVDFRPGVEIGVGELTTLFGINLDVLYTFGGYNRQTRWIPYIGAGPNFALSHKGFSSDDVSATQTTTTTTTGTTANTTHNDQSIQFQRHELRRRVQLHRGRATAEWDVHRDEGDRLRRVERAPAGGVQLLRT